MTQKTERAPERAEAPLLPIDIDYSKFLAWLIDRRRIPNDWHTLLKTARTLTRTAYASTPPTMRAPLSLPNDLPAHSNLTYWDVRNAMEALLAPDAPEGWGVKDTDLLGRYRNPIHRAWAAAVVAFENRQVRLADAAQLLVRHADVEAPAIRSRIAGLTAEAAESVRREGHAVRSVAEARQRYIEACQRYDMDPETNVDFQDALVKFVDARLPALLREAAVAVRKLGHVVQFYEKFAAFVAAEGDDMREGPRVCETLRAVMEVKDVGDVIRIAVRPTAAVSTDVGVRADNVGDADVEGDSETGGTTEIDWGIEVDQTGSEAVAAGNSSTIDWGIDVSGEGVVGGGSGGTDSGDISGAGAASTAGETDGIDWGIEVGPSGTDGKTDGGGGIDWGIDDSSTMGDHDGDWEHEGSGDGITLADSTTRDAVLNDLHELAAFLSQRCVEAKRSGGESTHVSLRAQLSKSMPADIASVTGEDVLGMRKMVDGGVEALSGGEVRHVLGLSGNRRVLERAAKGVVQRRVAVERCEGAIVVVRERRGRLAEQIAAETPKMRELGSVTRAVLRDTEQALSKLYQGRTVHILGEINNIFPPDA